MFNFSILDRVSPNLQGLEQKAANKAFDLAIQDTCEKIGQFSQNKVPHLEGRLKSEFGFQKINGAWYVGYNTEYASFQHQGRNADGTKIIRKRPGGGQSFYLTGPVQENQQELLKFLTQKFYFHLANELKKIFR